MDPHSLEDRKKFADIVKKYYRNKNHQRFPWREKNADAYEVLMAEIFLQRTGRNQAARVFREFISLFPDAESLANADREQVKEAMKPLGLHWRADNVHELAVILCDEFDGKAPDDERIYELPGVGSYVGDMFLCLAFDRRIAPVDANVGRVLDRVFGLKRKNSAGRLSRDKKILNLADECLPDEESRVYNLAIVDLGNEICKSKSPSCDACPLAKVCSYRKAE